MITHKIGVVSDTHMKTRDNSLVFLNEVVFKDAETVIHCGDIVRSEVLDAFYDKDIVAVSGNMDDLGLKGSLYNIKEFAVDRLRLCILHSHGYGKNLYKDLPEQFPDTDIFLYGHTHIPKIRKYGDYFFFNPGSFSYNRIAFPVRSAGMIELYDNLEFSMSLIDIGGIDKKQFKKLEVIYGRCSL